MAETGYDRIVEAFDKDETAGSFLDVHGEGGFAIGVYRMSDEITRLRTARDELVEGLEAIYDTARRKDWQMNTYDMEDALDDLVMIGGKARALIAKHGDDHG